MERQRVTSDQQSVRGPEPDETPKERVDRELGALTVYLVLETMVGGIAAAALSAANAAVISWLWFVSPMLRRHQDRE